MNPIRTPTKTYNEMEDVTMKWNGIFKAKSVVVALGTLMFILVLSGMDCEPEPEAQEIKVTARFNAAVLAETPKTVSLTVADAAGKILPEKSTNLEISGDSASGTVKLQKDNYIFDVKVYNQDGYLIGWGREEVTVDQDTSQSISITITSGIPSPIYDVTIDVTLVDGAEVCQSIPALFIDNAVHVYNDSGAKTLNSYFPTGWMGDTEAIQYEDAYTTNPNSGETCAQITYSAEGTQEWAGMYWLPVPTVRDDWGNIVFGINLTEVTKLTWYARGKDGGEKVEFFTGDVTTDSCTDSLPKKTTGLKTLTTAWQEFTIDLSSVPADQLTHVIGGFGWAANKDNNSGGCTFYVDEVKFVK